MSDERIEYSELATKNHSAYKIPVAPLLDLAHSSPCPFFFLTESSFLTRDNGEQSIIYKSTPETCSVLHNRARNMREKEREEETGE